MDIGEISKLCLRLGCRLLTDCPLSEYTTFRLGGICRAMISINSAKSAVEVLRYVREKSLKYGVIGRGSNIIASDSGFDGVILLFGADFAEVLVCKDDNEIKCSSGALLSSVCAQAQHEGLSGMENLYGIPGTVGGALYMNAGAYGSEMRDIVVCAEYIDESNTLRTVSAEDMDLSYRHSIFADRGYIITSVTLRLKKGDPEDIRIAMDECMKKRKLKQPLNYPSAGSTFKRPEGSYASLLIEQCGLKGMTCGGAMVSEKHSGFIVNKGGATCEDVLTLCRRVQEIVREKTGFRLELEPVILS